MKAELTIVPFNLNCQVTPIKKQTKPDFNARINMVTDKY